MNRKQVLLGFVLFAFLALNVWVVASYGYVGFVKAALSSLAGVAVFVDLAIALTLVLTWLVRDARERGVSWIPYAVVTLFLGSVGPLTYLLRRERRSVASPSHAIRAAQGA